MSDPIEREVLYGGRVQGVGFRYSTIQIAAGFEVVGRVRNLADGRVELEVRGERAEVNAFLAEIRHNSHLAHHILECSERDLPSGSLAGVRGFTIAR